MTGGPVDPTRAVYEQRAAEWVAARRPTDLATAAAFVTGLPPALASNPVVDLGCGPGWYLPALGPGAIGLDSARAMLDQARASGAVASGLGAVQADLAALPFRAGALGGAFANRSFVHLARTAIPLALHDLHRSLAVGAGVHLHVFSGDLEHGVFPDDDFGGRRFSLWPRPLLEAVVEGAGFTVTAWEERPPRRPGDDGHHVVELRRERTLADTVGPAMRLLVCGLNPSVYAADAGVGFARPGNRFWPAARAAGLVSTDRDPVAALRDHGIGMTDLVKRATPRADGLTAAEFRHGLARLERLCAWLRPGAVAFVGLTGWRAAVDRSAQPGVQPSTVGGVPAYVLPSTSGANAHASAAALAEHLRAAAALAQKAQSPSARPSLRTLGN